MSDSARLLKLDAIIKVKNILRDIKEFSETKQVQSTVENNSLMNEHLEMAKAKKKAGDERGAM